MRLFIHTAKVGVAALMLGAISVVANITFAGNGDTETGNVEACSEAKKLANLLDLKNSGDCSCLNSIYGWTCSIEADG